MTYCIKYLKEGRWTFIEIILPKDVKVEEYIEKNFSKDFIIYTQQFKSRERIRKEELIATSKFDLLRQ